MRTTFVLAKRDTSRKSWLKGNGQWREVKRVTMPKQPHGDCLATGEDVFIRAGAVDDLDFARNLFRVWFLDDWSQSCVEYHRRVDLKMKQWRTQP